MANKRAFSMNIVDSDFFLDMPLSAQCLYFHLNMRADDDGFVGNAKRIMRMIGSSEDDMNLLIAKKFVLTFDSGVLVIKHWRIHNTLSKNRYHETTYLPEKEMLKLKQNKAYSFNEGDPINDENQVLLGTRQTIGEQQTNNRRTIDKQKTNAKEKKIKEKKIKDEKYGDFFAICWQAYPKKKGKGSISESKIKFLYDHVGQEQMLRCIERYKSELSGKDNQFVMYGSTFFNSGYVDYLDENYEKSATNPSYADDNAVMKQNITDEYIHLCNAIPGCRDDNNQQLRTKYWSIIQSDNLEIAWHNAMQISEIASKEVRRVEKQERELFTLGEFLNELSSRNSSNRKSAG